MLKRYFNTIQLNSYRVDKDLIYDIQEYFYTQIPKYIDVQRPTVDQMAITLHYPNHHISYKSIYEYKNASFDKELTAITLDYSLYNEERGVVVCIRFDKSSDNSLLQICVYDEADSNVLSQLQSGILPILNGKTTKHWFYYSPESILVPFLVLGLMICLFGFILGGNQIKTAAIILVASGIFYLVAFKKRKGAHFI